ncbi:MAG: FtsK/SpoIIIE domain-containing protein [Terrimicrobiaceae bacterium]
MNSPVELQIHRSFDLLTGLKDAASEFARKESQLSRNFTLRRMAESRKHREETGDMENWLAAETAKVESRYAEKETRIRKVYNQRRSRIETVRRRCVEDLQKQAQRAKDRCLMEIQMRHLNATRNLPLQLNAEDGAFAAFSAEVAVQQKVFARQERRLRGAFRGYPVFLRLIRPPREVRVSVSVDPLQILEKIRSLNPVLEEQLLVFRRAFLPKLFSCLPLYAAIPLALAACAALGLWLGAGTVAFAMACLSAIALTGGLLVLHRAGGHQSREAAGHLAAALMETRNLVFACTAMSQTRHDAARRQIQEDYDRLCVEVNTQWAKAAKIEEPFLVKIREKTEIQVPRILEKNERLFLPKLRRGESERASRIAEILGQAEARKQQIASSHNGAEASLRTEEADAWSELQAGWTETAAHLFQTLGSMNDRLSKYSPAWDARYVETWAPSVEFPPAAKFASLHLDLNPTAPKDSRLALPGPAQLSIPLALAFPSQGSLLFETSDSGSPTVIGTLNNIILRLLSTTPPGKLSFTIIDPVGLGQNFSGLMHLTDYEETLINRRIWTQRDQIEERLAELNEHIEKVIQMYLRNEYATITEYNAQADSVAEKYHFLVVADFPANFSETAAKRLQSIAASGARCGVFTLIHWDRRQPVPDGFVPDELRKNSVCIRGDREGWAFVNEGVRMAETLAFDPPPPPELEIDLVHRIGRSNIDSNRVEVPFAQIAPKEADLWTNDTTGELRVAIGRTGATKLQYLAIGKGTRQHALFAGKTGSGKSTLFHVIITNLALSCTPEQVEFYLIDFKKGVEFKCYATHRLPHARVVAIESDREFGLSVLRRVDEELKRRGDMFRALGVQDIAGYKKAGGSGPMPRTLLIIDEFQEFFIEDDEIAQTASLLFDRIVRQGRAFGIHVLLGSQTLGGAYTLARATLGQMVIRVALQCNEADAYLIMDDNNPAPRLLSRPGEGIYNDAAGAIHGNSPFQVVWLPDDERDAQLERVRVLAEQRGCNGAVPIVFEGNAPADIRGNALLHSALDGASPGLPAASRCWLGAPNSIKGPTEVVFHRQSGNHLLIVGQRDETITTMLAMSLVALAAQHPAGTAKFVLFHTGGTDTGDPLKEVAGALPHDVTVVQPSNVAQAMNDLSAELQRRLGRTASDDAPPVFVFVHGLQKFKKLRHEDEFDFSGSSDASPAPGAQLNTLISEGSSQGIHLIVTFDSFNNIGRFLSRKALGEFEMRVVFQMSANDSASLTDSPQAASLGLHRALFYNEREGHLETFRPYASPAPGWIHEACQKLGRPRIASGQPAEASPNDHP